MNKETVIHRLRMVLTWVRAHTLRTLLILAGVYLLAETLTIPWLAIPRLRTEQPGTTAIIRQRMGEAEDAGKTLNVRRHWVALRTLPGYVPRAVIAAEDGTFYEHGGIDWFEVQESIERNVRERRAARGASTITQQLAKNLYLSTSKTPMRKAKEFVITLLLEYHLPKARILELYLNVIEWGRGIFGIEAAARTYFGKSASALTLDEAVRLAAVIPRPLRSRPDEDSRYVLRMRRIILARLAARHPSEVPADTMEKDQEEDDGL